MTFEERQRIREERSERLRAAAAATALRQELGWACKGCGVDMDDYSLECKRCWDRAHSVLRWNNVEKQRRARIYLAERRLHGMERNRRNIEERATANPWGGGRPPKGGAGNDSLRRQNGRFFAHAQ